MEERRHQTLRSPQVAGVGRLARSRLGDGARVAESANRQFSAIGKSWSCAMGQANAMSRPSCSHHGKKEPSRVNRIAELPAPPRSFEHDRSGRHPGVSGARHSRADRREVSFALGKPAPNAPKYFASVEICALARDRDWLDRATRVLTKFWLDKNSRKPGDRFADIARKDQKLRSEPVSVQRSRQSPGDSAN